MRLRSHIPCSPLSFFTFPVIAHHYSAIKSSRPTSALASHAPARVFPPRCSPPFRLVFPIHPLAVSAHLLAVLAPTRHLPPRRSPPFCLVFPIRPLAVSARPLAAFLHIHLRFASLPSASCFPFRSLPFRITPPPPHRASSSTSRLLLCLALPLRLALPLHLALPLRLVLPLHLALPSALPPSASPPSALPPSALPRQQS
ncbi:hypothetical protein B0H13DRAFT_2313641 [Mycena leptocephala]|nr:hypothetical protein B0H13DRAFT_2313641 [Mycena leptocephala]